MVLLMIVMMVVMMSVMMMPPPCSARPDHHCLLFNGFWLLKISLEIRFLKNWIFSLNLTSERLNISLEILHFCCYSRQRTQVQRVTDLLRKSMEHLPPLMAPLTVDRWESSVLWFLQLLVSITCTTLRAANYTSHHQAKSNRNPVSVLHFALDFSFKYFARYKSTLLWKCYQIDVPSKIMTLFHHIIESFCFCVLHWKHPGKHICPPI